ncbi:MAG: alpha/beta fold hydrolase [Actinomycetes bacterium]
MTSPASPEVGTTIVTGGIATNLHDLGSGDPILLLHGSGPGVTAWANWRLVIPALAEEFRVVAPDIVGFGFTERPEGVTYDLDTWTDHAIGVLDALGIEKAHVVGNSFGGSLALSLAIRHPERVNRLVLMGSVGVPFDITPGLDAVWGYQPSVANMQALLHLFAYDTALTGGDLAELRYRASIRPGVQEAFAAMFPAPRQAAVDAMTHPAEAIRTITHPTLVVHGRDDQVIPMANSLALLELIDDAQLHVYGRCGHWTQIEHADEFGMLIADFFRRQAS